MAMRDRAVLSNASLENERGVRSYSRAWARAPLLFRWISRKALRASNAEHGRALDVGSGPGLLLIAFAKMAPLWEVVGLDISVPMIAEARRRISDAALEDRVTVTEGSALEMPFDDESFDVVVMTNALHNVGDVRGLLSEIERVLAPGGVFIAQAYVRDPIWPVRALAWLNSFVFRLVRSPLEGMHWVVRSSFTVKEVRAAVEKRPAIAGCVRRRFGMLMLIELRKTVGAV